MSALPVHPNTTAPVITPPPPAPAPAVPPPPNTRPGRTLISLADDLGLLGDLAGTWVGTGFNVISLPDFSADQIGDTGPAPFRVKFNSTIETLTFTPIGGLVPNRGVISGFGLTTGQPDISLTGLSYLQRISDEATNQALHIEPGFWLNIPPTVVPLQPASTIARLGTIPHGNSLLAQGGAVSVASGPNIQPVSTTPSKNGQLLGPPYTAPFINPGPLPAGFRATYVANPNLALIDAISGQNITQTNVLIISTTAVSVTTPTATTPGFLNNPLDPNDPGQLIATGAGGITNIPFVQSNANATKLDAIFWIETVKNPDGSTFLQLQYTQTVILNFLGIDWPHISVATLVKQ